MRARPQEALAAGVPEWAPLDALGALPAVPSEPPTRPQAAEAAPDHGEMAPGGQQWIRKVRPRKAWLGSRAY